MIYSRGLGGVRVLGLGRIDTRHEREQTDRAAGAVVAQSISRSQTPGVQATGADLNGLIRWVFFIVIATAVVASLVNISQLAMINRSIMSADSGPAVASQVPFARSAIVTGAMSVLTIGVGFAAARLLSRLIADSLHELSELTGRIANGKQVDHVGPSGPVGIELARIYNGLRVFYANIREITELRAQEAETREAHDREIKERIGGITNTMRGRIEELTQAVSTQQDQIVQDSRVVLQMVETVRATSTDSVESVADARLKLERSAADLSQLVDQIRLVSEKASQTDKVSHAAVEDAGAGEREVQSLEADAESIGTVVSKIQDLAARIDLLAINAAIEAARSGSAGAGFAVVAREVKGLSTQTSTATEEIRSRIQTIREAVPRSAAAYRTIFQRLEEISANADDSASSVSRQEDAARSISDNASEAGNRIRSVAERIGSLAEETDQALAVANRLQEAAGRTSEVIDDMRASLLRELDSINEHASSEAAVGPTAPGIAADTKGV